MLKATWRYYIGFVIEPRRAARALIADRARVRHALVAVGLTAFLYTLVYVFLWIGDGRPFKPWLAISPDQYYRWNRWFLAPSMFAAWILASGVAQLIGRGVGGEGTFEDVLSVLGFGVGVASWATLLHDLVSSALGAAHVIDQQAFERALNSPTIWRTLLWLLMSAYLVWFVVLFTIGVSVAHRLRTAASVALGTLAFAVYQLLFVVFNR